MVEIDIAPFAVRGILTSDNTQLLWQDARFAEIYWLSEWTPVGWNEFVSIMKTEFGHAHVSFSPDNVRGWKLTGNYRYWGTQRIIKGYSAICGEYRVDFHNTSEYADQCYLELALIGQNKASLEAFMGSFADVLPAGNIEANVPIPSYS